MLTCATAGRATPLGHSTRRYIVSCVRCCTSATLTIGISIADGDEQSATALLRHNRSLRMSDEHRAAVWEAWQRVIDPLVKRMADIYGEHTVPDIVVTGVKQDDNT